MNNVINMRPLLVIIFSIYLLAGQSFSIARVHYNGGGDWYSNASSLPNLLRYLEKNTTMSVYHKENKVKLTIENLNQNPYLYLNGHGNIKFNDDEVIALRSALMNGSFLHADDNYGMDKSFRREIRRAFPYNKWVELSHSHPIFHLHFSLPRGLPKVHQHDGKRPQLLGLYVKDRLAIVYSFQSDLGDGWEDSGVHAVSEEKRVRALRMGTNFVVWALSR